MILAIESSALVASVALAEEDMILAEYTTNQKKTHSQTLLPMIHEIFQMTGIEKEAIEAIAITSGPGSFTGLRIGSATAKGLALAWDRPIIPVPTVDALAYNLQYTNSLICPIMDARRNQVYAGIYENRTGVQQTRMEQNAMAIEDLIAKLNEIGEPVIFLGDGVPVNKDIIDTNITVPHFYAPAHLNRQRAAAVAVLGTKYYKEGKTVSADEHAPDYLRLSQAERERLNRD